MLKKECKSIKLVLKWVDLQTTLEASLLPGIKSSMEQIGTPTKLIALTMLNSKAAVKIQQHITTKFEIDEGLR